MKSPVWFAATVIALVIFMGGLAVSMFLLFRTLMNGPGHATQLRDALYSLAIPFIGLIYLYVCVQFKPEE